MKLRIVGSKDWSFNDDVDSVKVIALDGEVLLKKNHASYLTVLKPGSTIRIKKESEVIEKVISDDEKLVLFLEDNLMTII